MFVNFALFSHFDSEFILSWKLLSEPCNKANSFSVVSWKNRLGLWSYELKSVRFKSWKTLNNYFRITKILNKVCRCSYKLNKSSFKNCKCRIFSKTRIWALPFNICGSWEKNSKNVDRKGHHHNPDDAKWKFCIWQLAMSLVIKFKIYVWGILLCQP